MGYLEEMLLRNGLLYTAPDGSRSYIEGSILTNTLVVKNRDGKITHRVERSWNGVDYVVVNTDTRQVETTFQLRAA